LRILYVEDNPADADLTRRALLRHAPAASLHLATSLAEARQRLAGDEPYDLLLSDIGLPDGTGLELVSEIRETRLPLAVVMLAGTGDVDTVVAALRAGADDYVIKDAAHGPRLALTLESALTRFRTHAAQEPRIIRLMYAEPDANAAEATRRHLEKHAPNVRVEVVAKIDELLRRIPHGADLPWPCDVLLLECRMEGEASLDMLRALLSEGRLHVPVVMLGQEGDEQLAAHALRLGADVHYLVKHPNYLFALPATLESAHRSALLVREQERLRDSEERFRQLADNIQEVFWMWDPGANKVLYISPAYDHIWGRSGERLYADPDNWLEPIHPEDRPRVEEALRKLTDVDYRIRGGDGSLRWIHDRSFPVRNQQGEVYRVVGVAEDVTERKRAEEQLQAEKALSETLLTSLPGMVYVIDREGRLVRWNREYEGVVGRSGRALLGADALDPIVEEDKPPLVEKIRTVLERGGFDQVEARLRDAGGEIRHYIFSGQRVEINGEALLVGTGLDVTERRREQEALRKSDERFRRYFELGLVGLAITSPSGGWLEVNDEICGILGYERSELLRMSSMDLTHPDDAANDLSQLTRVLSGETDGYSIEKRFVRKDGEVVHAVVAVRAVRDSGGAVEYFVGLLQDVTERRTGEEQQRLLEAQLRQAQKMEAVGRLAGGVAHDFNNMLNVILGYADLALRKVSPVDPLRRNLEEIHAAAERSADLTRRLLAFSRRQVIAPRVLDLNQQMRSMESLLRRIIGEDVDLSFALEPGLWPVSMDPSQVDQVVANLAVNARDAMPDGGKLTVETGNATLDETYSRLHAGARAGDHVMLAVSDTGCGMDAPTLERVFEPFFTTKPEGQGTGLGLAMVYGIVRQNGGSIRIVSEPGRGTSVRLYVPRCEHGEVSETIARPASVQRGHETILLVEDEAKLRELAREILEQLGYRVLAAGSPGEAISLCEKHAGGIDLLLTDVVMPVMNGRELADRVLALRPRVKVLFTSGYTANAIAHRGVLDPDVAFLAKPFSLSALSSTVRATLDRA